MEYTGIDVKYARQCIESNRHNDITAHYYLLLKKHITEAAPEECFIVMQSHPVRNRSEAPAPRTTTKGVQIAPALRKIAEGL